MTREEAISILSDDTDKQFGSADAYLKYNALRKEALEMAIIALKQEPCEDAISRDAVKELIKCGESTDTYDDVEQVCKWIDALPSVTQKSGHWIPVSERLPEHCQNILFSTKTDRVFEGRYFKDETEHQWYSFRDECFAWSNVVTAWMPLPKPFKPQERSEE